MKWEFNDDDVRGAIMCQCIANHWPEPELRQIKVRDRYGSYSEPLVTVDFDAKKPEEKEVA